jgi:N-glycosylase/DNA lyase
LLEDCRKAVYNRNMNINKTTAGSGTRLCAHSELDLEKTFECGQCFRWTAGENGDYTGVAGGRVLYLWREDEEIYIDAPESDLPFWRQYFDLDADYESASAAFDCGEYMRRCVEFGRGIRILRQDRWEALCSFIISQCNNIPRIKSIVETLCRSFGEPIEYGGKVWYSFPPPERIAVLTEDDLAVLRAGYRAPYILAAARAVASGEFSFEALDGLDCTEARAKVLSLRGVGVKVANCFMLFGLHRMEAFPIDVWMKRALKEHFPKDFDPAVFGPWAGLAQQYIFYYARSGDSK